MKKKQKTLHSSTVVDTNMLVIPSRDLNSAEVPKTTVETKKWSNKKRKRFDAYVTKKIKKEKRSELLKELSGMTFNSELLLSTGKLGQKIKVDKKQHKVEELGYSEDSSSDDDAEDNLILDNAEEVNSFEDIEHSKKESSFLDVFSLENVTKSSMNSKETHMVDTDVKSDVIELKEPIPTIEKTPKFYVTVKRKADIQEARENLPIFYEEQSIMEAINENPVVIVCGETGSGKTTQVPQFLYEAGYGNQDMSPGIIGITQPRRIAAISMAHRVAKELNMGLDEVSYQIRYESSRSTATKIKFMTDGILLREVTENLLLLQYSAIVLDEAHERNLNTDLLIGILSRAVKLRNEMSLTQAEVKPLKLIIMSATLQVRDFVDNHTLFPIPPPVIHISSRQYPVQVHFNRTTSPDYLKETFRKVCKIHTKLPPGGILIFLTGQQEINHIVKKLKERFPSTDRSQQVKQRFKKGGYNENEYEDIGFDFEENEVIFNEMLQDDERASSGEDESIKAPMHILPLYSTLPAEQQLLVFDPPPLNHRLCIVATNVAETSITIPGIKYVVDCGKAKEKCFDIKTGIQKFEIRWISKASAEQRSGRAGRTEPGHCYRLYSSAVYENKFEQFLKPEIERTPIEGMVLLMKEMRLDNIQNFPFPTPPPRIALLNAEERLALLGALDPQSKGITDIGRKMSKLPVSPRCSKMILLGDQHGCLPFVIMIVSALSVGSIYLFLSEEEEVNESEPSFNEANKLYACFSKSDLMKLLSIILGYERCKDKASFCKQHRLHAGKMNQVIKLKEQLSRIVKVFVPTQMIAPPDTLQQQALIQIMLTGYLDQIAIRKDLIDSSAPNSKTTYLTMWGDEDAVIHRESVLYKSSPEMIIYDEMFKTSKVFLKNVTEVEKAWLTKVAPHLCSFKVPKRKTPSDDKEAEVLLEVTFGPKHWPLPAFKVARTWLNGKWHYPDWVKLNK